MFKALREKISGWFGKKETEKEKTAEKPKKETKHKGKVEKSEKKTPKKEIKKIGKEKTGKKEKKIEEVLKKETDKIEEEAPLVFHPGLQKHVPDLESIKDRLEEPEEVEEKELEEIITKIRKLSEKDIDKLFFDCGWNDSEKGNNLALPDFRLKEIKNNYASAKKIIEVFVQESGVKNILKVLEKLEGKEEVEEVKEEFEEVKEKLVEKEELGFFGRLKKRLSTSVLKQEEFEEIFEDLEFILLENNAALEVVDKIKEELGKDLVGISVKKGEVEKTIKESLKSAVESVLIEGKDLISEIDKSLEMPYVILFFGINGSGKTTSIAKLAWKLKEKKISCVLAAGDTFRAASIEQLEAHAQKIGVPIVKGEYGKDPASVAFDAISYAKKNKIKVVLIDTAGRMYTKANLMKEMEKIVRVAKANKKIFVGESITGNDATEQAKIFNETAGIDGIILTKADVDEKAGAILSVSYVTGKPILFLGTGQEYKDLEKFEKGKVLEGLGL